MTFYRERSAYSLYIFNGRAEGLTTLHLGVRRFKSENWKKSGFSGIFRIFSRFLDFFGFYLDFFVKKFGFFPFFVDFGLYFVQIFWIFWIFSEFFGFLA